MLTEFEEKEMEELLIRTLSWRLQECGKAIEDLKKCIGEEINNFVKWISERLK